MSETPRDDPEHDASLTALYRAGMRDEPPPALDDAIRAAARRAVVPRPRLAGSPFSRAWQVPLSIAAVIVLSVSLVTLMGEEAPEPAAPPPAAAPPLPEAAHRADQAGGANVSTVPKVALLPEARESGGIGLKPPPPAATPGTGIRRAAPPAAVPGESRTEQSVADRTSPAPAQRQPATAFPGSVGSSENRAAAPATAEVMAQAELNVASSDSTGRERDRASGPAAPAASSAAPVRPRMMAGTAPAPSGEVTAHADLPPEKWLERIADLRRQGRLEEARTSLTEFRKRFPDYVLPAALKDGIKP